MNKEDFLKLLDKFLAGSASSEEEQQLLSYYHSFQKNHHWDTELLKDADLLDQTMWKEIEKRALTTHLSVVPSADPQPMTIDLQPSVASNSRRWLKYAAAIIIVLGSAAYLWINNRSENSLATTSNNKRLQNDLLPGGNKAILTLADGSKIVLDSASNGILSSQGNAKVIKLASGEIVYNITGRTAAAVVNNTMSTPRGGQYKLTLSDGTTVWLNSASSITYPTVFAANERKITVTGEAYFEVARNKEKPFIVDINGKSAVEVLGTSFNINSYPDESSIRTTLIEGSVKVIRGTTQSIILKPGQQAQINTTVTLQQKDVAGIVVGTSVDVEEVTAWKNGMFHFKNADITTVMRHLARWYDVEVSYEGSLPKNRFEGEIPMDANASQVLRVLQKNNVHFRIDGKKIIVTP